MNSLTEEVRICALSSGAGLVGFAPIRRYDNAPPGVHPCTIFPQTKTLIAIAIPQARGTLKAVEEGTYWQSYTCDSYWYLNEVVAPKILREIVMLLEEHGYTSVPVHNPFGPQANHKRTRPDMPRGPDGIISLRVAGCAAGLGELGLSKIFLTPEFGPRQRVFAVLTDAELVPTPLFRGSVCDNCKLCLKGCQADAMSAERTVSFTIEDRTFSHAPLDCNACGVVHRGEDTRYSPFWVGDEKEGTGPRYHKFLQDRFRHLAICVGRGCLRSCLDHLEKSGKIKKQFKTPLIERPRWEVISE